MSARTGALSVCALLAALSPAAAQTEPRPYAPGSPPRGVGATDARPGRAILPADQDWSFLDNAERTGSDRLKRLTVAPGLRFSLAGLTYVEFEGFDDGAWGFQPGWDGYSNNRLNLYGELAFGDRARVFAALKHGARPGSDFPVSPAERDAVDLHQAFAELSFGDVLGESTNDALVRIGRQELHYGGGRMISVREGPNVRDDFDGVLARVRTGRRITDAFAFHEVTDEVGSFDNETDEDRAIWGLYTSAPLPGQVAGKDQGLDLYWFANRTPMAAFVSGPRDETRHSVGTRWFSAGGVAGPGLSWDAEATAQFGASDAAGQDGDVRAWSLTASAGYGWDAPLAPTLILSGGFTSGDDDPSDGTSETFRAPYPPGRYFGDTTPLGPGNLMGASAALALAPRDGVTVTPGMIGFWRMEEEDGAYSPGGTVVLDAAGEGRFIGWEANLGIGWDVTPALSLSGEVARFFPNGSYLAANAPGEDITRVKVQLAARF